MNHQFMESYKMYLTPLSPIHIGCGEEFEPTNYIVDNKVLYRFEPSKLRLTNLERQELLKLINMRDSLPRIHRFFFNKKDNAIESATYFASIGDNLMSGIKEKVGMVVNKEPKEKNVYNRLVIERNSYNPISSTPYIPGSGLKGAIVTAVLDQLYKKSPKQISSSIKESNKEDSRLKDQYLGRFDKSIFSLFKPSDFCATSETIYTHIQYVVNRKKQKNSSPEKGISTIKECIHLGQYRSFGAELAIWIDEKKQKDKPQRFEFSNLIKQVNTFYSGLLHEELNDLQDFGLISQNWVESIRRLLEQLKPKFDANRIMLVRVGRHTGAESKSYRTNGVAKIKINNRGKGGSKYLCHATTVWLAAERSDARYDMYPLGWALIEINPTEDDVFLLEWTQQQKKHSFNRLLIIEEQQRYQKEIQEKQRIEEEKRILEERKRKEEEENHQQLLKSLTNNQKRVQ